MPDSGVATTIKRICLGNGKKRRGALGVAASFDGCGDEKRNG